MIRPLRSALLLAVALSIGGCGVFKAAKPKTPVLGQRQPILAAETSAEVDPTLAAIDVLLPPVTVNADWAQPGGNPSHAMGHLGLSATPARAWSAQVTGGGSRVRLAAAPVVANGRVFVMDTRAEVHAFDAQTGAKVWTVSVVDAASVDGRGAKQNQSSLFGGGVSAEGDRLFATNGLGDVVALNAADGAVIWRKRPGGPLRGDPALSNGAVYAVSQDNQIFALAQSDGAQQWSQSGTLEVSGVFGVAAPASARGTVVAGFSSGELNAYRYENGRPIWQDALARTSISTTVGTISDIDAEPVVYENRVFAIGSGGRMVALELLTGQRAWEINAGGIAMPWAAGEWLFVVTNEGRLLCVARSNGRVRWAAQLPRWRSEKSKRGAISWTGPVLAGNRLIAVSTSGQIAYVNPASGAVEATVKYGKPVSLPPVGANNTLYLLDEAGTLTAWR